MEVVLLPGAEFAQYGLAVFAVAGLIYLVDRWVKSKADNELAEVVENNTKALENLTANVQQDTLELEGVFLSPKSPGIAGALCLRGWGYDRKRRPS